MRIVDGSEMIEAARQVAKACGTTGFVGFDFVLEAATGTPIMIEMNPRAVPLCHIPFGPGRDLVQALLERSTGVARKPRIPATMTRSCHLLSGLVGGASRQSSAGGGLSRCAVART